MIQARQSVNGFTLIELLIVLIILSIISTATLRLIRPSSSIAISLATEEVANAIIYAVNESYRQNKFFGVEVDISNNRLRVFELDTSGSPATPQFDVYHPITKKLYTVDLDEDARFGHTTLSTLTLSFDTTCNGGNRIYFDSYGEARCIDPLTVGVTQMELELSVDNQIAQIEVEPGTGKVTVQ